MQQQETRAAGGLGTYLTGFALALILTAVPFALVATGALAEAATLTAIAIAAVAQTLVHLRFFLHLGLRSTPRETCWRSASQPC